MTLHVHVVVPIYTLSQYVLAVHTYNIHKHYLYMYVYYMYMYVYMLS